MKCDRIHARSSRNKRKNFKPRNIVNVDETEDEDDCQEDRGQASPTPMDLSRGHPGEGESEEGGSEAKYGQSLSVVRPEILFGDSNSPKPNPPSPGGVGPPTGPPHLALGLLPFFNPMAAMAAASAGGGSPAGGSPSVIPTSAEAAATSMRDAFQEVLKLYGVPTELAEAIAKNAQAAQGKSQAF